jgi:hypothetical protein
VKHVFHRLNVMTYSQVASYIKTFVRAAIAQEVQGLRWMTGTIPSWKKGPYLPCRIKTGSEAYSRLGARDRVVVEALCYKTEGRGFETRCGQ